MAMQLGADRKTVGAAGNLLQRASRDIVSSNLLRRLVQHIKNAARHRGRRGRRCSGRRRQVPKSRASRKERRSGKQNQGILDLHRHSSQNVFPELILARFEAELSASRSSRTELSQRILIKGYRFRAQIVPPPRSYLRKVGTIKRRRRMDFRSAASADLLVGVPRNDLCFLGWRVGCRAGLPARTAVPSVRMLSVAPV